MLRIVVKSDDAGMALNVGGSVETTVKTFDVDLPALESYLTEHPGALYFQRQVVGVEVLPGSLRP